ncbi:MAG TPA: efflux RND transporter periplasmic adaptor subunit [Opitutaceae bacterium]|nr:efflux RND transporter periplasmic adaptor subunit [Opitutaceae bacterium]
MNPVSAPPAAPTANVARKKSKTKWFVIGAIVLVVLLGAGAIYKRKHADGVQTVTVEKAVVKTITQVVSATGKVQPETEVKIAPEVSGEITQLKFREGAVVKKGELLLTIKPDAYQAQVEQQEANLVAAKAGEVQAKAQLLKAQDDLKRNEDLFKKSLISDSDIAATRMAAEVAQANYDSAVAQIRRTEGSLSQARDQLTKTMIYAPIDGKVSSLSNEIGDRVAGVGSYGGAEVMRVADLDDMEVRVNINENDIVNVKVGDKAKVSIDAFPNRKFDGIVKEIGSAAKITGQNTQDEVTNFLVKIRIVDKDAPLRPGMSANADVETKTVENVVAVPIQSVTARSKEGAKTIDQVAADREKKTTEMKGEGAATAVNVAQQKRAEKTDRENTQRVVFVYDRNAGAVKMVPVETGVQDTTHIEIKSGLKAGDEVVSGSFGVITRTLKDGMKVELEKPKTDKKKAS